MYNVVKSAEWRPTFTHGIITPQNRVKRLINHSVAFRDLFNINHSARRRLGGLYSTLDHFFFVV